MDYSFFEREEEAFVDLIMDNLHDNVLKTLIISHHMRATHSVIMAVSSCTTAPKKKVGQASSSQQQAKKKK